MTIVKEDYEQAIETILCILEQMNDAIFDLDLQKPENYLLIMPHAVQIWKTFYAL